MRRPHPYGVLVLAAITLALILSLLAGEPTKLPGAALGSVALLHVLRASAFVVAFALLFTVLARAWAGELPVKFGSGGLEYTPRETTREIKAATEDALADVLDRLEVLEERVRD